MAVKIRKAGVRGKFYPYEANDIETMIKRWNEKDDTDDAVDVLRPKAIISPHAGYIYSGYTANKAHKLLPLSGAETIVVIGPSHHVAFRGISASFFDKYETPFGLLDVDADMLDNLNKLYRFTYEEKAHYLEHSTETQMPFIAYYNGLQTKVIELIYGLGVSYVELGRIIRHLLVVKKKTAVVISTDLSHFYNVETAKGIDRGCILGVERKDLRLLQMPCEACGKLGMLGLIKTVNELDLNTKVLSYTHSGDITGDYDSVVGYMSAVVW